MHCEEDKARMRALGSETNRSSRICSVGIERVLVRSRRTRVKYPKETNPMRHTSTPPEVMTLDETARYLRLSKRTVRKLAKQGRLPGREIEGDWRFLKTALE